MSVDAGNPQVEITCGQEPSSHRAPIFKPGPFCLRRIVILQIARPNLWGLGVLLGNDDGTFGNIAVYPLSLPYFNSTQALIADINGVGKPDALLVGCQRTRIGPCWIVERSR